MYTLAYDESSGFESFDRNPRVPIIITAVMYNDCDKKTKGRSDTIIEQLRVMSYLWHICKDSSAQFPRDLHTEWSDNSALFSEISNSLAEFLQYGTYNDKELLYISNDKKIKMEEAGGEPLKRKGSYQLHTMYRTQKNISEFFSRGAILIDDEASNTYINMVKNLIRNAVFLNGSISSEHTPRFNFEFPTRVMPVDRVRDAKNKTIYEQFYPDIRSDNRIQIIGKNDALLFANIIDTYSREFGEINIEGDLRPESIDAGYNTKFPKNKYAFMFLADIITSYLKRNLYDYVRTNSRKTADAILSAYNSASCPDFGEDSKFIKELISKTNDLNHSFKKISFSSISPGKKNIKGEEAREWLKTIQQNCKEAEQQYEKEFLAKKEPTIISIKNELKSMLITENDSGKSTLKVNCDKIDNALGQHKVPDISSISTKDISWQNKSKLNQLKKVLEGLNTIDDSDYFNEINLRMQMLIGNGVHRIYCYDDIDYYYYQAASSINKKEYFNFYSNMYDCVVGFSSKNTQPDRIIREYYENVLFKELEDKALSLINKKRIQEAVESLIDYRFSDNRSTGKLLFIFKKINGLYNEFANANNSIGNLSLFRLYDVGMSAYTHVGDTENALDYYHKCMDIKNGIPRDERQYAKNRLITIYNDLMNYEKAEEVACEILEIKKASSLPQAVHNRISHTMDQPVKTNIRCDITEPVIYKTASSLGQTYAFMNNNRAEVFFKEVIDSKEDDPDRNITISYCLHWFIESNQKDKYEKMAFQYFGCKNTLSDQLNYLITEGTKPSGEAPFSMDYALFVFIKAFYRFYKEDPRKKNTMKQLVNINDTLNTTLEEKNRNLKPYEEPILLPYRTEGHPWEIIFKYAALMEKYIKGADNNNISKSDQSVSRRRKGGIVDLVVKYGELEFLIDRDPNNADIEKRIDELWSLIKNNPDVYSGWTDQDGDLSFKRDQLKRIFSYMYH